MVADASWIVWLAVHLLLYFALDLATLATLGALEVGGDLGAISQLRAVVVDVSVAVSWGLPLHGAGLLLAAGALVLLRSLAGLRWFWFRLAALAVFGLPALLAALLLSSGDVATVLVVLPMHIVMGLLVVQPGSGWANAEPAMDQHGW